MEIVIDEWIRPLNEKEWMDLCKIIEEERASDKSIRERSYNSPVFKERCVAAIAKDSCTMNVQLHHYRDKGLTKINLPEDKLTRLKQEQHDSNKH